MRTVIVAVSVFSLIALVMSTSSGPEGVACVDAYNEWAVCKNTDPTNTNPTCRDLWFRKVDPLCSVNYREPLDKRSANAADGDGSPGSLSDVPIIKSSFNQG